MAGNKRPRKKHQPRPTLVRPITFAVDDDSRRILKLIPHKELDRFRAGEGTEGSWHDLVARLQFGRVISERNDFGMDLTTPFREALEAMASIKQRYDRVAKWGASGDEVKLIGQALVYADDMQDATTRREHRDVLRIVLATCAV